MFIRSRSGKDVHNARLMSSRKTVFSRLIKLLSYDTTIELPSNEV